MNQITKTILTVIITVIVFMAFIFWLGGQEDKSVLEDFYLEDFYQDYMDGCMEGAIGLTDYPTAYDYCQCTYKELSSYENEEILDIMKDALDDEISPKTAKIMVDVATKCRGEIK